MDTWEVEDVTEAKRLIDSLKNQVKSLSEASSSSEDIKTYSRRRKTSSPQSTK